MMSDLTMRGALMFCTLLLSAQTAVAVARDCGAVFPGLERKRTPMDQPAVHSFGEAVAAFIGSICIYAPQWIILLFVWRHL